MRWVHLLLFGAELALERGNPTTANTLSLRLIGFLDGSNSDHVFLNPIRYEGGLSVDKASALLVSDSDRRVNRRNGEMDVCLCQITSCIKWSKPYMKLSLLENYIIFSGNG